jgi:hypothetical protein
LLLLTIWVTRLAVMPSPGASVDACAALVTKRLLSTLRRARSVG